MGINGLLRALESIAIDRHLRYYQHKRMAVDGYCWLHKSVYLMTDEIVSNPNSKKYLIYLTRRLDRLLQYNIIPVIVFDGDKLPMKRLEEDERLKHRLEVTQQGRYLLNQGMVKEAQAKMIEGLDINPQMAYEFIQELKKRNIEYYVAPYEADVQLAYLSKKGLVDCVITEDSDLIALGCKRVLFKLDPVSDIGKEISYDRIVKCKFFIDISVLFYSSTITMSSMHKSYVDIFPPSIFLFHIVKLPFNFFRLKSNINKLVNTIEPKTAKYFVFLIPYDDIIKKTSKIQEFKGLGFKLGVYNMKDAETKSIKLKGIIDYLYLRPSEVSNYSGLLEFAKSIDTIVIENVQNNYKIYK